MAEQDTNGVIVDMSTLDQVPKKRRRRKAAQHTQADIRVLEMAPKSENEDLNLHVSLCEQRYKELEGRLDGLDKRLTKVEADISALKTQVQAGFADIKLLLEQRNTSKSNQLIATIGVLGSAALALIGYIVTRH